MMSFGRFPLLAGVNNTRASSVTTDVLLSLRAGSIERRERREVLAGPPAKLVCASSNRRYSSKEKSVEALGLTGVRRSRMNAYRS